MVNSREIFIVQTETKFPEQPASRPVIPNSRCSWDGRNAQTIREQTKNNSLIRIPDLWKTAYLQRRGHFSALLRLTFKFNMKCHD
jgi:hypothetical protein